MKDTTNWLELFHYQKGYMWSYPVSHTQVLFVSEGSFRIAYDSFLDEPVRKGQMLLLYPGMEFKAHTAEGVSFIVLHLHDIVHLCDRIAFSTLAVKGKEFSNSGLPSLEIKPILHTFLELLLETFSTGLRCSNFLELKVREFLFLLRGYYTKKELHRFFHPVLNRDIPFAAFVLDNFRQVRTVTEFATLYSCSLSSFDKKFRNTFGTSSYQWMLSRKADIIYHEIHTTTKTFRLIAEEQGFLSLSQFTDFCKKHLGNAPSKIRHKKAQ